MKPEDAEARIRVPRRSYRSLPLAACIRIKSMYLLVIIKTGLERLDGRNTSTVLHSGLASQRDTTIRAPVVGQVALEQSRDVACGAQSTVIILAWMHSQYMVMINKKNMLVHLGTLPRHRHRLCGPPLTAGGSRGQCPAAWG